MASPATTRATLIDPAVTSRSQPDTSAPQWRFQQAGDDFIYLMDGQRPVVLIHRACDCFELLRADRAHADAMPLEPKPPRHYHYPCFQGVRVNYTWRLRSHANLSPLRRDLRLHIGANQAFFTLTQPMSDGSESSSEAMVTCEQGRYVVEVSTTLRARQVFSTLEYCNLLPGGLTDTRPGRQRYRLTFWQSPDALRRMGQNPLWWCSCGAQDEAGQRRIAPGGFLGFGCDRWMNPVFELIQSDPPTGASTCDGLQDEHIWTLPPSGESAMKTGWYVLTARYRIRSIDQASAERIAQQAQPLIPGPMLAWKFQYTPLPQLPQDLRGVELPGSPFYGPSDWSQPVPWDREFDGRLWTPSPDPTCPYHWDRTVGRTRPGAILLRPRGERLQLHPASGHPVHTDAGRRYRLSASVMTRGNATAWIEAVEMLFNLAHSPAAHHSKQVGPNCAWQTVEAEFTARGEEAPFVETLLCATGDGEAWFTDFALLPL